jgi:hypothetical protein
MVPIVDGMTPAPTNKNIIPRTNPFLNILFFLPFILFINPKMYL